MNEKDLKQIANTATSLLLKSMDIGIFIEYSGVVLQIPVNPRTFNVSTGGNNATMEIITLGEIVIPKKKKLSTISWEGFFPAESWHPYVRTKNLFVTPSFYLSFLEKIRDDCKPCHLTVTGIGFDSDVVIESFDYYHQAGDHEDTYYSISFKKYEPYAVSIVGSKKSSTDAIKKQLTTAAVITAVGTIASKASVTPTPKQITIGCEVILNGTVHEDSYGSKPGKTFTDYRGKVSLINKKGSHCYHITTPSGDWLGWVTKESVVLV